MPADDLRSLKPTTVRMSLLRLSPTVLKGEDAEAFNALLADVWRASQPKDVIDETWTYEWACHLWESQRWRRLKMSFLRHCEADGLAEVLAGRIAGVQALVSAWRSGDPVALSKVASVMAGAGITQDDVFAQASVMNFETIEKFEVLIAKSDARRDAIWRQIEQRQDARARRLRDLAATVIEEAEVIAPEREPDLSRVRAEEAI